MLMLPCKNLNIPFKLFAIVSETVSIQHSDKETLKSLPAANGQPLGDLIALNIGQIGENIAFSRAVTMTTAGSEYSLCGLTHPSSAGVIASDRVQVHNAIHLMVSDPCVVN